MTSYSLQDHGTLNHSFLADGSAYQQTVKNFRGQLYKMSASNTATTNIYLRVYDKAIAPVPGTDTPVARYLIPPGGREITFVDWGMRFLNGISYVLTSGSFADSDVTPVTSATAAVNTHYF